MIEIKIEDNIKQACPEFVGAVVCADITNSRYSAELWEQITGCIDNYRQRNTLEDIKMNPVIAATRTAYKNCGKDPNRYRPSAEALCRRIVRNLPLYQINTVVDIINLISIRTGYSIGGFDTRKIDGGILELGIGKAEELYEGIGRGVLNIEGLPVYRDSSGGIGTPTSDNERTKIDLKTMQVLIIINGYNGRSGLEDAVKQISLLLHDFAFSQNETVSYF